MKAADKRGANVAEVSVALAALEKTLANGWTYPPPGVALVPPRELVELRAAVELAARKGENVGGVVWELEALEKAMTGRVQQRPRPVRPPDPGVAIVPPPPVRPAVNLNVPAPVQKRPDPTAQKLAQQTQWAEAQLQRAAEYRRENPLDPDAVMRFATAQEAAVRARAASGTPAPVAATLPLRPEVRAAAPVVPPAGRVVVRVVRLGLRFDRVAPAEAERNGLANGAGLRVTGVADGSPAAVAEFRVGDVLVEFAGRPVTGTTAEFIRFLAGLRSGDTPAVVVRDGKRVELKVAIEVK